MRHHGPTLVALVLALAVDTAEARPRTPPPPNPAANPFAEPPPNPPLPELPPPNPTPEAPAPPVAAPTAVVEAAPPRRDRGAFVVGVKAGGLFPQPVTQRGDRGPAKQSSTLGASFLVGLEVGYFLPFVRRSIGVLLDVGYSQPETCGAPDGTCPTRTELDPRVDANGGAYRYALTQRELMFGLTVLYRIQWQDQQRVIPFVGVGPRLWLLDTHVSGEAGAGNRIAESQEQSTKVGLAVPLGVALRLGPGNLFLEGQLFWAPLDHRSTGETSVGAITVDLGYRLLL